MGGIAGGRHQSSVAGGWKRAFLCGARWDNHDGRHRAWYRISSERAESNLQGAVRQSSQLGRHSRRQALSASSSTGPASAVNCVAELEIGAKAMTRGDAYLVEM